MKIEKEYNLQELANKVKESIKLDYRLTAKTANLNLITAQQIVDVLETVASWEKDKANEMELHNKKDANGNILRGAKEGNDDWNTTRKQMELHEKMTKMLEHLQRANGIIPVCFGNYEYDKNQDKCFKCEYIRKCAKSSDTVPDCYGCYEGSGKCTNCKEKTECLIDKQKKII